MLAYWSDHVDSTAAKYSVVMGDITQRTGFDYAQFDAVLTLSVLEHVSDLEAALYEMARVTRSGGEMLHIFGPAWSCPYGHHLYIRPDDPNLNFARWQMPAHLHLLCNQDEICRYYDGLGYDPAMGQYVWDDFQSNGYINRIFYDDYISAFHRYQVERWETMFNPLPVEHVTRLRKKYPGRRDFSTYGGRYKLLV
jgi:SAM-dependent methyltransferase